MKKCSKCENEYPETNEYFNKSKNGFRPKCKSCHRQDCKKYYKKNKEKFINYRTENREEILKKKKEHRKKNKKQIAEYKKYYHNKRYHEDINYRLLHNCGGRIRRLLKKEDDTRTVDLLGCSIPELKQHLEKQFQEGMTWDNYGVKGWHIDHIIPCDSFDFTKEEDQRKCFHYTNLQPLWAIDNIRKSNKQT